MGMNMSTKTWEPTCHLRFVKKKRKDGAPRFILQQKWEKVDDMEDVVLEERWEEVPLVTSPEPKDVVIELNDAVVD
jgi:hypothetical protein